MKTADKYEANESKMAKYLSMFKAMMTSFDECEIHHIPRYQNTKEDRLSKISSIEFYAHSGKVYL